MQKLKRIFQFLYKHKYASTIVLFVLLITYLDSNCLYNYFKLKREASELQAMIDSDSIKTAAARKVYIDLQANPREATVKIAR